MEILANSFTEIIDSTQLQRSIPEYLWFVIALLGLSTIIYVLHRLVNFLIENITELKEDRNEQSKTIAVMMEMMAGFKTTIQDIKTMVADHEQDIRSLQSGKRNRGQ